MIKATVESLVTGRVVTTHYSASQILEFSGEHDLVDHLTTCDCQAVGETNVVECNCEAEWEDFSLNLEPVYLEDVQKKVEVYEKTLREVSIMHTVGWNEKYVLKRYAEHARDTLKYFHAT